MKVELSHNERVTIRLMALSAIENEEALLDTHANCTDESDLKFMAERRTNIRRFKAMFKKMGRD